MPCKPQSGYHLKGFAIIIIKVITALLITIGKKKKTNQKPPAGTPRLHLLHSTGAYISPSLMSVCTSTRYLHAYMGAPRGPAVYPAPISSGCSSTQPELLSLGTPGTGSPAPWGKPDSVPVTVPTTVKLHKHGSTTWAASGKFRVGSSSSNLRALQPGLAASGKGAMLVWKVPF